MATIKSAHDKVHRQLLTDSWVIDSSATSRHYRGSVGDGRDGFAAVPTSKNSRPYDDRVEVEEYTGEEGRLNIIHYELISGVVETFKEMRSYFRYQSLSKELWVITYTSWYNHNNNVMSKHLIINGPGWPQIFTELFVTKPNQASANLGCIHTAVLSFETIVADFPFVFRRTEFEC